MSLICYSLLFTVRSHSIQAAVLLKNLLTVSVVKHAETLPFHLELLNSVVPLLLSQEATWCQVLKNVWIADVSVVYHHNNSY